MRDTGQYGDRRAPRPWSTLLDLRSWQTSHRFGVPLSDLWLVLTLGELKSDVCQLQTIVNAIGKRALLFGYTAGLIVARGAILLGFWWWCCLVGSSRTVGAFTGTCRTFVGWFRVCGVAVLSGFRIIKALRAVSLCGVGEVNSPPCARTYSVSRDW